MTAHDRALRPLRPRTVAWQLAVLVVGELAIYLSYARYDSHFHYATHLLVALTAVSLWQAGFLLVTGRPTRFQLLALLGFHLWATWPDVAFRFGVPHERWMDWVALAHVSSHYLPGGDTSWLLVGLTAAAAYAVLLSRWLQQRADGGQAENGYATSERTTRATTLVAAHRRGTP